MRLRSLRWTMFLACAGSVELLFAWRGEGVGLPETAALASCSLFHCLLLCCVVVAASTDFFCASPVFVSFFLSYLSFFLSHSDKAGDLAALQNFSVGIVGCVDTWTGSNPCTWHGITCNGIGGVILINLDGSSCQGTINFLYVFPINVTSISLFWNSFSGSVDLRHFPNGLTGLDLSYNQFSGTVDLRYLPASLTSLHLNNNALSGTVVLDVLPASLTSLSLNSNQFSGIAFGETLMDSSRNDHGLSISTNPFTCPLPAMPSWLLYPGCVGIHLFFSSLSQMLAPLSLSLSLYPFDSIVQNRCKNKAILFVDKKADFFLLLRLWSSVSGCHVPPEHSQTHVLQKCAAEQQ